MWCIAGCHCRVCYGWDVVPLQGAIVVCYCGEGGGDDQLWRSGRSAIAGCHCGVLWGSGRSAIAGCHCRVPL